MTIVRRDITTSTAQSAVVCQLALIGLQLLCRLLGSNHPQLFAGRDTGSVSEFRHSFSTSSFTRQKHNQNQNVDLYSAP